MLKIDQGVVVSSIKSTKQQQKQMNKRKTSCLYDKKKYSNSAKVFNSTVQDGLEMETLLA